VAFIVWSTIVALAMLPLVAAPRSWMFVGLQIWTRGSAVLLRLICGIRVEIRGEENFPRGAALIAAKHQCTFDALAPIGLLPRPFLIAKQELAKIPLYGWYVLRSGLAMAIDREGQAKTLRAMITTGRQALDDNRQIVIFPEGTRAAIGAPPDYKPGVAALYSQLKAPCTPMATNAGAHYLADSPIRRPGVIVFEFLPAIPAGLKRDEFMHELQTRLEAACDRLIAEGV
jgi:1-acyl-sn-glycerol-3-phosphate acyltransferase